MAGTDYTMNSLSLEFPAGSEAAEVQCMNVAILDDTLFEEDETFTVGLTVMTSDVMTGNDTTTITITENDCWLL